MCVFIVCCTHSPRAVFFSLDKVKRVVDKNWKRAKRQWSGRNATVLRDKCLVKIEFFCGCTIHIIFFYDSDTIIYRVLWIGILVVMSANLFLRVFLRLLFCCVKIHSIGQAVHLLLEFCTRLGVECGLLRGCGREMQKKKV